MRCKNKNSFACFVKHEAKKHQALGFLVPGIVVLVSLCGVYFGIKYTIAATPTNAEQSTELDKKGEHFEIMYFNGPTGEQINTNANSIVSNIADAGFTIVPLQGSSGVSYNYDELPTAIQALDSKSLKTLIYNQNFIMLGDDNVRETEEAVNIFRNNVYNNINNYINYKNVIGYHLVDEPSINSVVGSRRGLDQANKAVSLLYQFDPMRTHYINLYPNYADKSCLDNFSSGCNAEGNYDLEYYASTYLPYYFNSQDAKTAKYLSVDYYPHANSDLVFNRRPNGDRNMYYSNLRTLLNNYKVKRNNSRQTVPMNIVSLMDWHIDTDNKNHIMYQVSTNLAFGMKALSYFVYMEPETHREGWMVDDDGVTKTSLYDDVADINGWAYNLGSELFTKEVDQIYQLSGTNYARIYQDANTPHSIELLQASATKVAGGSAQAIVTSFDDGSIMFTNGEPNSSITISLANLDLNGNVAYYHSLDNAWGNIAEARYTRLFTLYPDNDTIVLPAGSNVLIRPGNTRFLSDPGVMVDVVNRRIISYSSTLSDVTTSIYNSSVKSLSGNTLTLDDGNYTVIYPTANSECKVTPAAVFVGINKMYGNCGFSTTNTSLLSMAKLDDNYVAIKYKQNGSQVKNIPIVSATSSSYQINGNTIKTNGAQFSVNNITVKNGVGEKDGNNFKIYTWPKKVLVATYSIDESSPVIYPTYSADDWIFYDPVNGGNENGGNACNETNYWTPLNTNTTCYRWFVVGADSSSNANLNLLLDHNIGSATQFNAQSTLETLTSNWTNFSGTKRLLTENEIVYMMGLELSGSSGVQNISRPTPANRTAVLLNVGNGEVVNENLRANVTYYLNGYMHDDYSFWSQSTYTGSDETTCSDNTSGYFVENGRNVLACRDVERGIRPVILVSKSRVKADSDITDITNTVINSAIVNYGYIPGYKGLQGFTVKDNVLAFYALSDSQNAGLIYPFKGPDYTSTIPTGTVSGAFGHGNGMSYNPDSNKAYIVNGYDDNRVWILDGDTFEPESTVTLPNSGGIGAIGYNGNDGRMVGNTWYGLSVFNQDWTIQHAVNKVSIMTGQDMEFHNGYAYFTSVNFNTPCPNYFQLNCRADWGHYSGVIDVYNMKLNSDGTPSKGYGRRIKRFFINGNTTGKIELESIAFNDGEAWLGYSTKDLDENPNNNFIRFYHFSDDVLEIPFDANVSFVDGANSTTILISADDQLQSINGYSLINNGYTLKKELPNRNVGENNLQVCDNYDNCTTLSFTHVNPNIEKDIFELTLDANGGVNGTTNPQCMVTSGVSCVVTIPTIDPTRSGYNFLGWANTKTATVATMHAGDSITLTANKTIYAVWAEVPVYTFTLSYNNNTGTGNIGSQQCTTTGSSCNITVTNDEPTKANYFFLGWAENSTDTAATIHAGDSVTLTADKTIYAIWAPIYTLSFDTNGGTGTVETQSCHPSTTNGNCSVTIPNVVLTRDDYTFLGWSESDSATEATYYPTQNVNISSSITFYAVWKENEAPGPDDPDDPGGTGEIIWIQDQNHQKGNKTSLIVKIDYPVEKFVSLMIDDTIVDADNYTAIAGSTVISIKYAYVDGLTTGEHTLVANYQNDITVQTTFTIADAPEPEPGPEPGPEPEPTPEPTPEPDEGDIITPDTGSLNEKGFDGAMPVVATLTFWVLVGVGVALYKKQRQKEHIVFDK